jgi:glycogen synthase
MNILFLSRDYPPKHVGGVGTYFHEMSRILAKNGHRVFVITEAIDTALDYLDEGVHVFRIKPKPIGWLSLLRNPLPGWVMRLEYSLAVSKKIKELVLRYSVDIVESCEARAEGFWFYLFRNKPPLVIKLHTPEGLVYKLNREAYSRDRFLIEKLEEHWLLKAKQLIGLSKAITDLTRQHYKTKFKNIPIVPNPIDISSFKYEPISKNENMVLYTGRLEFRKGVHVLARAIPHVLKKTPETKFVLIGDDCGMKSYLVKKMKEFDIENSVTILDQLPREQLLEWYRRSSMCVVPSLWENHPYAILEAMACGRPVIATRVGGISEIIQHEQNGLLVETGSTIELAEAIVKLSSDEKVCGELGANARKTIETRYAPEEVMRKTLSIYERLIPRRS